MKLFNQSMVGQWAIRIALAVVAGVFGISVAPAPGAFADEIYAPADRVGPSLRPSVAAMEAATTCSGNFDSGREAVLLVPGTAFDYKSQFAWSWAAALTRAGIPWCAVSPPYSQLGDLTIAGEYDVYAIRKTYQLSGNRPIAVVGHSQGGMQPRWALRFWPDTRSMVADYVGVAPDSQGFSAHAPALTPALAGTTCTVTGCPQGIWQQLRGSQFVGAINSVETFEGIDYSIIYSTLDGGISPADTPLHPAPGIRYSRVALQDICPVHVGDHLTNGTVDAVAWALIMDAITQPGPVDASRIDPAVCGQLFIPGQDPATGLQGAINAPLQIAKAAANAPRQSSENPLPCYVYAECRTPENAPSPQASASSAPTESQGVASVVPEPEKTLPVTDQASPSAPKRLVDGLQQHLRR